MRSARWCGLLALVVVAASIRPGQGGEDLPAILVARTEPLSPDEERKKFHLPPGFEAELVAAEPQIHKPMNLAFDDRGRIWVTDTVEYPFPATPGRKPRDTVKILEDTNGDGRADKVTTFADGLNIPIGILPLTSPPMGPIGPIGPMGRGGQVRRQEALVYSIPNIHRLTDTDGDDVADQREIAYSTFGFQDTHGMASSFNWGFDGWIYATHGFANTSEVKGSDGQAIKMQSGNTFRMKPDGSRVEQITWGQVNPFGLSFDPLGNLFSADCHSRPVMMLLRGGYYQSFGKPHDGLGFAPEICKHDHGSTGIAGIVYYAADHFPPEYRGTIFVGNPVTSRINQDRLWRQGSTLIAEEQPDFLKSDDPWFRPVDLKLGPDGALYVCDFYNRIIGHYEVPLTHPGRDRERGRIWRIVYRGPDGKGKAAMPRADWSRATVEELIKDLDHANLTVRLKAANQLVLRDRKDLDAALEDIQKPAFTALQRLHLLWVRERRGAQTVAYLAAAARDSDQMVRVHAMRVLAERPKLDDGLRSLVLAGLGDADPFVRRAAADALGRHASPENIWPIVDHMHGVYAKDAQLIHTMRMTLRNQLLHAQAWKEVKQKELAGGGLRNEHARALVDVSLGVPSEDAAEFLFRQARSITPDSLDHLHRQIRHIARHGKEETCNSLLEWLPKRMSYEQQADALRVYLQGRQERGAAAGDHARRWAEQVCQVLLASKEGGLIQKGAELAGSLKLVSQRDSLVNAAARKQLGDNERAAAIHALMALDAKVHLRIPGEILNDASEPLSLRERMVQTLAGINQPEARQELLKALPAAPARLANLISAGLAGSREGAEQLLKAVAEGKASPRLFQERPVRLRLQQWPLPDLEARIAKLTAGLPPADQKLQDLLMRRRDGFLKTNKPDPMLGAKVFEKHCAACHQLAGKGTKIGPQLDGIGLRGLDRLLEDTIDPNRNIDHAFRATTFLLKGDRIISGLVLREEGEVTVVADAQGKEIRVTKGEIDERSLSQLSPMPANLVDQIPEGEFYELLAYLLAQRQKPK